MDKKQYTKLFLQSEGIVASDELIRSFLKVWWATPFSPIGLRLSSEGNRHLSKELNLTKYTCQVKSDYQDSLKMLLLMSKHITAPFYLPWNQTEPRILTCYGEEDAVMLMLMGGDLASYLQNFTR